MHVIGCGFVLVFAGCSDDTVLGPDSGQPKTDATIDQSTSDATTDAIATDGGDGAALTCLTSSGADAFFTLNDSSKCVVAAYTVATPYLSTFTWGRHQGPLTATAAPAIVRYAVPASPTGALTATTTPITATGVPNDAYWSPQAVDLPFFSSLNWTAVSYTGSTSPYPGQLIVVDNTGMEVVAYDVNGFFADGSLAASDDGRLLFTGLSPLTSATSATNTGALYAADSCGTAASNPRLLPAGDTTCKDSFEVGTWQGGSSGPVAVDAAGNGFAILSMFGGNQELRGFAQSAIARGQGPVAGNSLFAIPGYTSTMVADGTNVYFQSNDATTYTALDVQAIGYTVSGGTVAASGSLTTALTMVTPGTAVTLIVDDAHRLWVGVTNPGVGDAGPTSSTFFVIADK